MCTLDVYPYQQPLKEYSVEREVNTPSQKEAKLIRVFCNLYGIEKCENVL